MIVFRVMLGALFVGSGLGATTSPSTDNTANSAGIIIALIALAGTVASVVIPIMSKKIRGHADVRDDATAENATLKEAAATAMVLVDKAQSSAKFAVEMRDSALEIAKDTINDLRRQVADKDTIIADYRTLLEQKEALSKERLQEVEVRLQQRTSERDELLRQIAAKEQQLAAAESQINDLTLAPEAVAAVRKKLQQAS